MILTRVCSVVVAENRSERIRRSSDRFVVPGGCPRKCDTSSHRQMTAPEEENHDVASTCP